MSGKDSKKRAKLAAKAQTIEEIWESVSSTKNGDLTPAPSRIVLTPRSAEACLRHGLNPEVLRIRPLDSFSVAGIDPTVQRLRHETYTQRRFEMMRLVRAERKRLVNQEEREAELAAGGGGGSAKITPQQIIAAQAKQNATFLDEEEKRMQKMRKRQDKELEQMMQFEMKMQEIQAERDRRMALDKRKEEAVKRTKEKRARQVAEEQRLREAKKQAAEENEEARRLAASRSMFERERALRAERELKEKKAKQDARAREEERLRKHEEHRLQTQRILAEQQAAIKRRMDDMELAERERQALVARKREEERERLSLRRAQMEARIERNMQQAAKVEEQRKEHFFSKQAHHEQLRQQHLEMQARERALQQHQGELQEQRRLMVLNQARRDEEQRKEDLLGRFELEEENVRRVREARGREHGIVREKKILRNQMKLENVERIRRIAEYRRLEYLRKIHEADRRTTEMMERKEKLVATRKQNALAIKVQKDRLMAVMEAARSNGARASKLLRENVKQLNAPASASAPGKKKRALGNGDRSQSAKLLSDTSQSLGPPPEGEMRHVQQHAQSQPQLPYVSPYEGNENAQTVTF